MAGLDSANRAILESHLGPIEAGNGFGEEADLEDRLERLAYPALVALEVWMARRGEMMRDAAQYSADNVRSGHAVNLQRIDGLIASLAYSIRNDANITLDDVTSVMVATAEGPEPQGAYTFSTVVNRDRRG